MQIVANSPEEYIEKLPSERKDVIMNLRKEILSNLPEGFEEVMSYGMIGYVIPHSLYPSGYHVDKRLPLPFMNIASQKNHIAVYHMGIYADSSLMNWFVKEFPKHSKLKLDMGKSCIRFKKMTDVPYQQIGELAGKMKADDWIKLYEQNILKK
jgi:uncharacterized protein YdhG (YjbR/CyaY superfamily)